MILILSELAKITDTTLVGNPDLRITGVEELEYACKHQVSFFENSKYSNQLKKSEAGAVFITKANLPKELEGRNYLITETPSLTFQTAIEYFIKPPQSGFDSIHPTAIIHKSVQIAPGVQIGPYTVIDANTTIGEGTHIAPHVFIGAGVTIGADCCLYSNVVIREGCELGNRITIQPGAVIGSSGFGFYTNKMGKHSHLAQLGKVVIEDDVSIGANTTIDRARFKITRIGRGTKIDNLVQIAHQVELGEDNLIVAQVGIAGSTKTGKHVVMGGQAGVAGHITIADKVILTARCAVSKTLDKADVYYGAPALPDKEFKRQFLALRRIEKMATRFKELEKRFAHLLEDDEESDDE